MKKTFRKGIYLLMVFLLLLSSESSVLAESFKEINVPEKQEIRHIINKIDAIKIADTFKIEFDGESIVNYGFKRDTLELLRGKVYNLFDMEDNLVAYLVLTDHGYIVVDANAENPRVLVTAEYGDSLEKIRKKLSESSSLYFIFPFTILTKEERDQYMLSNDVVAEDIVSVPKTTFSSDNLEKEDDISASVGNVSVELKNEENFVKLIDGKGKKYYGGNQRWFNDQVNRDKGCGVIALTNVVSHLAKNEYPQLYNDGVTNLSVNYNTYRSKMEGLAAGYLSPGLFGIPFVANYNTAANRFFKDKGYSNLEAQTFSSNYTANIKAALRANQPVPMLIWADGSGNKLNRHWITITKYFKSGSTNEQYIALSTWGARRSVNLDAILSGYVRGATYMRRK